MLHAGFLAVHAKEQKINNFIKIENKKYIKVENKHICKNRK